MFMVHGNSGSAPEEGRGGGSAAALVFVAAAARAGGVAADFATDFECLAADGRLRGLNGFICFLKYGVGWFGEQRAIDHGQGGFQFDSRRNRGIRQSVSNCVEREFGELPEFGAEVGQVVATALVEELVKFGEF
jgi:hypothetical protein